MFRPLILKLAEINANFTRFALRVDRKVQSSTLLDIPVKQWRIFSMLVISHMALSVVFFLLGAICFLLGGHYSHIYTEVNCSDGSDIFVPILNVIASFIGIVTIRALHLHWPPFIHVISLFILVVMNLIPIVDDFLMTMRWHGISIDNRFPSPGWAVNFTYMDAFLCVIAVLIEVVCGCLLYFELFYYCKCSRYETSGDERNMEIGSEANQR
ncbi:hypothetical protein L596_029810 [Steinernema carpocapsae]|uniref:Uncharacterized protein n=1 Tax=Steinernema carpocapsae TaxID=34508 RepID=A0A4U5LQW0_STECR|nr:hypothetical protein L596_029810 [Steinernema carpocapsae]